MDFLTQLSFGLFEQFPEPSITSWYGLGWFGRFYRGQYYNKHPFPFVLEKYYLSYSVSLRWIEASDRFQ